MDNNYQLSRIHNYVNGLMSKEDMYALEREALDDPFLQDAIDGYKLQNGVDIKQLSLLQQRLATRVAEKSISRNRQYYHWQRLTIGLVAAVMFVTVCSLILFRYIPQKRATSLTEVEIMPVEDYKVSIILSDKNTASPVKGWGYLESKISKSLEHQDLPDVMSATLYLKVSSQGKVIEIAEEHSDLFDAKSDDLYKVFESVDWRGDEAFFTLEVKKK